jgi:carbonic anhydrase
MPEAHQGRHVSNLFLRPNAALPRRAVLSGAVAAGGLLAAPTLRAQSALSPDAALEQMMAGNGRFVAEKMTSFDEDLKILKQHNVEKQEPFAAVLSCADSRVPVELVFDQTIGHLFVTRVAGNICTPEIIASLEYGAAVLGLVAIMVLGHSGCGAVKATIEAKAVPGQISALYAPLRQAVVQTGGAFEAAIKANVQIQATLLRTASPLLADLIGKGRLKVVGGYYDLASGGVTLLS